jgi:Leucine-rich repeat (LRR) protein
MNTLEQLRAGKLAGSQRLRLSYGLRTFPPEIFELADTLEILDLSGNVLSSLPDDLPRLHKPRASPRFWTSSRSACTVPKTKRARRRVF